MEKYVSMTIHFCASFIPILADGWHVKPVSLKGEIFSLGLGIREPAWIGAFCCWMRSDRQ
jgi:hypothetical protein